MPRLREASSQLDKVVICDHSNFVYNGVPKGHLLDYIGFHLSSEGTHLLCSNIRYKIELTLGFNSQRKRPHRHELFSD